MYGLMQLLILSVKRRHKQTKEVGGLLFLQSAMLVLRWLRTCTCAHACVHARKTNLILYVSTVLSNTA